MTRSRFSYPARGRFRHQSGLSGSHGAAPYYEGGTSPLRWHRWAITITPTELTATWDDHTFAPITEHQVANTRGVRSLSSKLPGLKFDRPTFGPGLGLYTNRADAVFRNTRLVPLARP